MPSLPPSQHLQPAFGATKPLQVPSGAGGPHFTASAVNAKASDTVKSTILDPLANKKAKRNFIILLTITCIVPIKKITVYQARITTISYFEVAFIAFLIGQGLTLTIYE